MRELTSLALRTEGKRLLVLDQTRLPDAEVWLDGSNPGVMVELIEAPGGPAWAALGYLHGPAT